MPEDEGQPSLAALTDEEQVALATNTDNGPRSIGDRIETLKLPQEPGSAVE